MSTVCFEKLYGYEKIYGNIYIVCLDNRQIICVRDIRFYKKDPSIRKINEEILLKVVFDKETEGFVLREVIFSFGDRLPLFRTSGTL